MAFCFALDNAGKSNPARMAIMAITTRSSIRVNARRPEQENRSPYARENGWFTDHRFTQTRGAVNADLASDANACGVEIFRRTCRAAGPGAHRRNRVGSIRAPVRAQADLTASLQDVKT